MSKSSLRAVAILASGLGLLVTGSRAEAASFGSLKSIPQSNASDAIQQVHYSHRYGWHCGMWEYYGHSHPEYCRRGPGYYGGGGYYEGGGRYHRYRDRDHDDHDHDKDRHDHDRDHDHDHKRDHKGDHDHD